MPCGWGAPPAIQIVSWSDTQVVATAAPTALTGVAKIQQNGVWSNAKAFTVPVPGGNTLVPALLTMMLGDTHPIQALSSTGQSVTGLTWTSSKPAVVSLSSEDPPVLTALAAGLVTITAGTASADVTVIDAATLPGGALPVGTVLWSNPGTGAYVAKIVPAVPSPSGVADVFAFQIDFQDGLVISTVQAITSDGTVAWTAEASSDSDVPDFQGGLIVMRQGTIVKLDGITGQAYPAYTPSETSELPYGLGLVHTDGTIFAHQANWQPDYTALPDTVIGIDPTTGTQKFSVPILPIGADVVNSIIAGDGYAYVAYAYNERPDDGMVNHLALLRISSSGVYENISIFDWNSGGSDTIPLEYVGMITNADTGILLTWEYFGDPIEAPPQFGAVITRGASASPISVPQVPGGSGVIPILQAQDGSFVGYSLVDGKFYMVAFDQTGSVRWIVPGYEPQIATADGGVIALECDPDTGDYTGAAVTFDQNGNATGQLGTLPTYSWKGAYQLGSIDSVLPNADLALILAKTFAAVPGGNLTGNGFSLNQHTFGLVFCGQALNADGTCVTPAGQGTPVTFSYLSVPGPGDPNFNQPVDFGQAIDFGTAYPNWAIAIKAEAFTQYKAAFAHLPALVARGVPPTDLFGCAPPKTCSITKFDHTNYVSGYLPSGGVDGPNGLTPFSGCNTDGICPLSWVYYLPIMGKAQQALGFARADITPGSPTTPVNPIYSPPPATMTQSVLAQFDQLMPAIGHAIGAIAAHETGHQLNLPSMECSGSGCPEDYIYQNGSSGSSHEWFYANIPGEQIHWSPSAVCAIQKYLLGQGYHDKACN